MAVAAAIPGDSSPALNMEYRGQNLLQHEMTSFVAGKVSAPLEPQDNCHMTSEYTLR